MDDSAAVDDGGEHLFRRIRHLVEGRRRDDDDCGEERLNGADRLAAERGAARQHALAVRVGDGGVEFWPERAAIVFERRDHDRRVTERADRDRPIADAIDEPLDRLANRGDIVAGAGAGIEENHDWIVGGPDRQHLACRTGFLDDEVVGADVDDWPVARGR